MWSLRRSVKLSLAFEDENGVMVEYEVSFDHRVASLLVEKYVLHDHSTVFLLVNVELDLI